MARYTPQEAAMEVYAEPQRTADGAVSAERARYIMELADTFEAHGREILKKVREDEPEKFWLFVSGVMRSDEALRLALDPSDEDLDIVVDRVVAGLRRGTSDEGKVASHATL
jgi:hypothetical protein